MKKEKMANWIVFFRYLVQPERTLCAKKRFTFGFTYRVLIPTSSISTELKIIRKVVFHSNIKLMVQNLLPQLVVFLSPVE